LELDRPFISLYNKSLSV